MNWKGLTRAAAMAVLACGSVALADSLPVNAPQGAPSLFPLTLDDATTAPASAPAGPTTLTPVMYFLDPTSAGQWLEKNKFSITGFVEGGYFLDTNNPRLGSAPGNSPTLIFFPGPYSNRGLLDQADITFAKGLDTTKSWDIGFTVEAGYGSDDAFIHSHGILDNRAPGNPQNQLDLVQANLTFLVPLGTGLTVTAGKFVTLLGNEVINPTGNQFYTHSYSFSFGVPLTNTGVLGTYTFAKALNGNDLTVTGGISRGWNQSTRDNNGAIDATGEVKGNITDKLSMVFNWELGPEAPKDNNNYWSTIEFITPYTVSDQLTVTGDFLYSAFPHGAVTNPGQSAQWYGAALYGQYKFNPMFALNLRAEWYRDQGGFTTGVQAGYYEGTIGLGIHPMPNDNVFQFLQLRPELRCDVADRRVFNTSHGNGAGDYNELTLAMDAIMQF